MASGPTTSWQINGKTMETVIIFLGSKIIANDDFSHEIKRLLLLGRKAMTNLDNVLKSRNICSLLGVRKSVLAFAASYLCKLTRISVCGKSLNCV